MKLALIIFWFVIRVSCSERNSESDQDLESLYPRSFGIINSFSTCYIIALFTCLYNNPIFQTEIFEAIRRSSPKNPSNFMLFELGKLFKDMRTSHNPIDISETMIPTILSTMQWDVGEYECILEFWDKFVEVLP